MKSWIVIPQALSRGLPAPPLLGSRQGGKCPEWLTAMFEGRCLWNLKQKKKWKTKASHVDSLLKKSFNVALSISSALFPTWTFLVSWHKAKLSNSYLMGKLGRGGGYPHFTEEEVEAQRGQVIFPSFFTASPENKPSKRKTREARPTGVDLVSSLGNKGLVLLGILNRVM